MQMTHCYMRSGANCITLNTNSSTCLSPTGTCDVSVVYSDLKPSIVFALIDF